VINPFSIARIPRIEFGAGTIKKLPSLAAGYGNTVLLVTGASSLDRSGVWHAIEQQLGKAGLHWHRVTVNSEPSPQMVDEVVAAHKENAVDVVVGIGGGSVLDAAKAISGLLRVGDTVLDYLEGVGPEKTYQGEPVVRPLKMPFSVCMASKASRNPFATNNWFPNTH